MTPVSDDRRPEADWASRVRTTPDPRWEAFAAREPYFSVLTAPRFLRANLTAADERAFFDSGEVLVDWILRTIELRLAPEFAPMSTLEYGCGVGRLAIPFARRPGSVTAVDLSPAMLEIARGEAHRQGASHIDFRRPAALFAERRRFDLITCFLVLQRMPRGEGLALLRALVGGLGPGGIAVFHVPYHATSSGVVETLRRLRRVPAMNAIANALQGKPAGQPFMASHTYNLTDVFTVLHDASIASMHVVFEDHEGLAGAVVFAQAALPAGAALESHARPGSTAAQPDPDKADREIDVRQVIARTSIEDLNQRAEAYYASLTDWEHHLAKPFSTPDETPALLMNVATLLQGLRLTDGTTVLEFGAGTGWLSRFLTQLGCRVILLDVSPTALRIARELYQRLPVIGDRPEPQFLHFDGRRIDLPDASVERVVSFHAFHHAPNPHDVLRELGRVLKPGGIAGFAEPGPRHSRSPKSQFELRTYGVVESDIDVHAMWRTARTCGFTELKLVLFHGSPFHVSLEEYEDFLAGGPTGARWVVSTRGFLRHVRSFLLVKGSAARADSRSSNGLACEIHATLSSVPAYEGEPLLVHATVTNRGAALWLASTVEAGGVMLGAHLYDRSGKLLVFELGGQRLTDPPREIAPGETVQCRLTVPPQAAGQYLLELDCVAARVTWFAQAGSRPATLPIEVRRTADR